uniref:Uncharacterized protein n=2 Tax=Hemiselmis andersenii TaxID=464988 RepID=A0A6U5CF48_HEMAN|mmetsp:Transcript_25970/g.60328  ORF Transcript_25970/g.60328 Transcript_25970/m.60328 type:complete len:203 (+) Transcript_25970:144-752(+)
MSTVTIESRWEDSAWEVPAGPGARLVAMSGSCCGPPSRPFQWNASLWSEGKKVGETRRLPQRGGMGVLTEGGDKEMSLKIEVIGATVDQWAWQLKDPEGNVVAKATEAVPGKRNLLVEMDGKRYRYDPPMLKQAYVLYNEGNLKEELGRVQPNGWKPRAGVTATLPSSLPQASQNFLIALMLSIWERGTEGGSGSHATTNFS